jgi:hypothetical protein
MDLPAAIWTACSALAAFSVIRPSSSNQVIVSVRQRVQAERTADGEPESEDHLQEFF